MLLLQQFQHFYFEVHLRCTEYRFQNLYDKTARRYLFSFFFNYYFCRLVQYRNAISSLVELKKINKLVL